MKLSKNAGGSTDENHRHTIESTQTSRREFIRNLGLGATALYAGSADGAQVTSEAVKLEISPVYYPQSNFVPDVDLAGKTALITGASRGIGKATAQALLAVGVNVIGSSRTPGGYPDIGFELLPLELADTESINNFVAAALKATNGSIDILINNAGQFVIGSPTPTGLPHLRQFNEGAAKATQVLNLGPMHLTNTLLHFMPKQGYSRVLFTASIVAYITGGGAILNSYFHQYIAGKRAILAYANSLRPWLAQSSDIKVTTLCPPNVKTDLYLSNRPIYTEPVDENGQSLTANSAMDNFQRVMQTAASFAQSPELVADAYVQLLQMDAPPPSVLPTSPDEPIASQSQLVLLLQGLMDEMEESAIPLRYTTA